ncbi:MAG: TerB family tellurite resistance protein [Bacteroidetes bacterium]|nr:MAG: TerB family tellurite resistance protein [Bacteroidota bacterium]MBL1144959.1 TerB family tellurite resistance protein [Bacteroidota bacterium]NOG57753.1 TerB family tellurite resistance protein [Bacteroidota bacterium]
MNSVERLYYALGELAYAVAKADGQINFEERNKLHDIVVKGAKCHNYEFNVSEIIFHILQKENIFNVEDSYRSAMREIKANSKYLTDDMKAEFVAVLDKVARAFNSITKEERELIERFRKDIDEI